MNKPNDVSNRPDRLYGKRLDGVFSVSGIVHVIRDESELLYFREGEILVAQCIDSRWIKQLSLAKALIEGSSEESSLKTIASHYDKPAVADVTDAVASLRSGDIVTIHASGEIELRVELRAPDSPMRVSVPDAVDARTHSIEDAAPDVASFADHVQSVKATQNDSTETWSESRISDSGVEDTRITDSKNTPQ